MHTTVNKQLGLFRYVNARKLNEVYYKNKKKF